jgi:hypothetical protein
MKETMGTLNKILKENGRGDDTEVTRFKGEYWLLHICGNGAPVPLNHDKDIMEIKKAIELEILKDGE